MRIYRVNLTAVRGLCIEKALSAMAQCRISPWQDRSLSIIVPAYCEAENILATLENLARALAPLALTARNPRRRRRQHRRHRRAGHRAARTVPDTRLLVNERNLGFGASYRRGVDAATLDHIVMVHGDNAWGHETLREFFSHVGEADIIVGYTRDMWRRGPGRAR